jgi:hypothetical protein
MNKKKKKCICLKKDGAVYVSRKCPLHYCMTRAGAVGVYSGKQIETQYE